MPSNKLSYYRWIKGTQVTSGKCCQADARRRFGNIYAQTTWKQSAGFTAKIRVSKFQKKRCKYTRIQSF